ncbi:MAG TPA: hypothetical protein VHR66_01240 [Gemmataceae bacterium]|jgi:hypothetical protein|nr:hypothetical protein [Gemmataceae bacterium]
MTPTTRVRTTRKNRRNLKVEALGDRITPVLGAFDIPAPVAPGSGYDGVASLWLGTASLLNDHRHILTAAHVGYDFDTQAFGSPNFSVKTAVGDKTFTVPSLKRIPDPGGDDIAVFELAELGPLHVPGYDIYTGSDEKGKVMTQVGFGQTGTGTTGVLWEKDVGVFEGWRIRFQGKSTGGTYSLRLDGDPNHKVVIAHNASASFIESALELLPGINDVVVHKVHQAPNNPYNGSFEVIFKDVDYDNLNVPDLHVEDNVTGAAVTVQKLQDGGAPRQKRKAMNVISVAGDVDGVQRLRNDFDDGTEAANHYGDGLGLGAAEGGGADSDSGSPYFINGKIAGVHKGPIGETGLDGVKDTRDFGEGSSAIRVSTHQQFIKDNLVGQYDLVLNMNHQVWGNDKVADTISVKCVGDQVQIFINGVKRYQDNKAWIKSVKVLGSNDNETITVGKIAPNVDVHVEGGGGNDTINVSGVSAGAVLWAQGDDGDDTFQLGYGDQNLASQIINANIQLYGNDGTDTVRILDTKATDTLPDYTIDELSFHRPFIGPVTYSAEKLALYTKAGGPTGVNVQVNGSDAETVDIFTGSAGDQIRVGDGNWDAIDMLVKVHGGGGNDTITVNDSASIGTDGGIWRGVSYSVYRMNKEGQVDYDGVEHLQLFGGDGDDTIQLYGTPSMTQVVVHTNGGADDFVIGENDLDAIGGNLSLDGGSGRNSVTFNDQSDTGYGQYTVGSYGVSKAYFQASMLHFDNMFLNLHNTGSTVRIDGTPATLNTITGGDGNDQFLLSPTAQNLAQLGGGLILDGKRGMDHVRLYDKNSTDAADELTVTGSTVVRDHFGDLSYDNMENLTLNLGDAANKVDLHGTSAATKVTINGNGGKDIFNVTDAPKSEVLLNGGAGFDIMQWNTGVKPSDLDSGFDLIARVSIEQTDLPLTP